MANDDRTTDHFIREVDEELRREQMRTLWSRFGIYVIIACVLVVAATAGYRGWTWWQAKQASERGDRYMTALEFIGDGDLSDGTAALESLTEGGGGYAVLARMQLAANEAEAGNAEQALAGFDVIAADGKVDTVIRDLARLRGGLVALGMNDTAGARERVAGLDVAGNSWRHAAREVLGMAAYTDGDLEAARENFEAIQQDAGAPSDARERASAMVSLIDSMQAIPSGGGGEGDTKSPE